MVKRHSNTRKGHPRTLEYAEFAATKIAQDGADADNFLSAETCRHVFSLYTACEVDKATDK
jgi:hypothetical protein